MSKQVLLADDNEIVRKFLRSFLESEPGVEVCGEATDGVDAVEKALELTPDLLVLDLSMPRMNGLEAARLLKQQMPSLPIVLFTSHRDVLQESDALRVGISAVVSKSENPEILKSRVLKLLRCANRSAATGAP